MTEPDENADPQAPAKLMAALRQLPKERVFVPQEIDERILVRARDHLRRQPRWLLVLPRWAALAASIVLVCGISYLVTRPRTQDFAAEDINRDGVVDILDAFALARKIEAGDKGGADFNQDGVVDDRDVNAVGILAVRLDKGGRS